MTHFARVSFESVSRLVTVWYNSMNLLRIVLILSWPRFFLESKKVIYCVSLRINLRVSAIHFKQIQYFKKLDELITSMILMNNILQVVNRSSNINNYRMMIFLEKKKYDKNRSQRIFWRRRRNKNWNEIFHQWKQFLYLIDTSQIVEEELVAGISVITRTNEENFCIIVNLIIKVTL